jgi:hypothetical protein
LKTYRSSERTTEVQQPPLPPAGKGRLRELGNALDPNQRLAAIAATALGASIFLPWWRDPIFDITYAGFRRLTFLEVAVFLVAASVLVLLVRRAEGRNFHLPLADATLIAVAGLWSIFLLVFRLLDPPTRTVAQDTRDYGMRWGILFALASAVLLTVAGVRERRERHRGQPEAVAAEEDATTVALTKPHVPE